MPGDLLLSPGPPARAVAPGPALGLSSVSEARDGDILLLMGEEGLRNKHNPFLSSGSWWRLRPVGASLPRPRPGPNPFLRAALEESGCPLGSPGDLAASRLAVTHNLSSPPRRRVFLERLAEEDARLGRGLSWAGPPAPLGPASPGPRPVRRYAERPLVAVEQTWGPAREAFVLAVGRLRASYPELSGEEAVRSILTATQVLDPVQRELTLQELLG